MSVNDESPDETRWIVLVNIDFSIKLSEEKKNAMAVGVQELLESLNPDRDYFQLILNANQVPMRVLPED